MPYQATQRPFGVEIEYNPYTMKVYPTGRQLGEGWRIHDEHCGKEAVSPILVGVKGHTSLERACYKLADSGAIIDRHCGLHVHHDVSDLSEEDILRLVESWADNEGVIGEMVDPFRLECGWCNAITADEIRRLKENDHRNFASKCYDVDRYKSLNVASIPEHGTVEVRFHEGTLDYSEIRAWVRFGQAFIHASKKRKRKMRKAPTAATLLERVKVTPKEKDTLYKKMGLVVPVKIQGTA